jgi:hypothetical protein
MKNLENRVAERCLDCSGYVQSEVVHCKMTECPLWEYRLGEKTKNIKSAVKKFCSECNNGFECVDKKCSLFEV